MKVKDKEKKRCEWMEGNSGIAETEERGVNSHVLVCIALHQKEGNRIACASHAVTEKTPRTRPR